MRTHTAPVTQIPERRGGYFNITLRASFLLDALELKLHPPAKRVCVSGNNWGNIACLQKQATLFTWGAPESHFSFLPITFFFYPPPFFVFFSSPQRPPSTPPAHFFINQSSVSRCSATGGIEMEHLRQRRDGEGGRGRRWREKSRTDVTAGITWKETGGRRGEGGADGSERVPASDEDVCVCVCIRTYISIYTKMRIYLSIYLRTEIYRYTVYRHI